MEPITSAGLAITAYLTKDGITKLLGPTAEYLGEGLKDLTRRRVESIGKIFSNASRKLGNQLDVPGQVPPRILRTVMNEASYSEDSLVLEYFGGVLASSRTEIGRDDRGTRLMKVVDNLSAYQIRTHYLLYSTIAMLFVNSGRRFGTTQNRRQLGVFLPFEGYFESMMFSQTEWKNPQILHHIWHGLGSDNLIENEWLFGDIEAVREKFPGASEGGIVCYPSAPGAELFLWALGCGDSPLEHMLSGVLDTVVDDLPNVVPGSVPIKPVPAAS